MRRGVRANARKTANHQVTKIPNCFPPSYLRVDLCLLQHTLEHGGQQIDGVCVLQPAPPGLQTACSSTRNTQESPQVTVKDCNNLQVQRRPSHWT